MDSRLFQQNYFRIAQISTFPAIKFRFPDLSTNQEVAEPFRGLQVTNELSQEVQAASVLFEGANEPTGQAEHNPSADPAKPPGHGAKQVVWSTTTQVLGRPGVDGEVGSGRKFAKATYVEPKYGISLGPEACSAVTMAPMRRQTPVPGYSDRTTAKARHDSVDKQANMQSRGDESGA